MKDKISQFFKDSLGFILLGLIVAILYSNYDKIVYLYEVKIGEYNFYHNYYKK